MRVRARVRVRVRARGTRLDHDAVAARDRADHRAEREQGRVVPRAHHQHDAERVALVRVRVRAS